MLERDKLFKRFGLDIEGQYIPGYRVLEIYLEAGEERLYEELGTDLIIPYTAAMFNTNAWDLSISFNQGNQTGEYLRYSGEFIPQVRNFPFYQFSLKNNSEPNGGGPPPPPPPPPPGSPIEGMYLYVFTNPRIIMSLKK